MIVVLEALGDVEFADVAAIALGCVLEHAVGGGGHHERLLEARLEFTHEAEILQTEVEGEARVVVAGEIDGPSWRATNESPTESQMAS